MLVIVIVEVEVHQHTYGYITSQAFPWCALLAYSTLLVPCAGPLGLVSHLAYKYKDVVGAVVKGAGVQWNFHQLHRELSPGSSDI